MMAIADFMTGIAPPNVQVNRRAKRVRLNLVLDARSWVMALRGPADDDGDVGPKR
jgi:hypothetical protein